MNTAFFYSGPLRKIDFRYSGPPWVNGGLVPGDCWLEDFMVTAMAIQTWRGRRLGCCQRKHQDGDGQRRRQSQGFDREALDQD